MKNDSNKVDQLIKYKYIKVIYDYEEFIKDLYYKSNDNKKHKGYLIKFKDLENLKEKIGYNNINKNIFIKYKVEKDSKSAKPYTIKLIEHKTSQYLINIILNNNKYILITFLF